MTLKEKFAVEFQKAAEVCKRFTSQKQVVLAEALNITRALDNAHKNNMSISEAGMNTLTESFASGIATTQAADMGTFTKFATNVGTYAIPNLIAFDIALSVPMKSRAGFVTFLDFQYGTSKGSVEARQTFNSPFMNATDPSYGSRNVIGERFTIATVNTVTTTLAMQRPIVPGTVTVIAASGQAFDVPTGDGTGTFVNAAGGVIAGTINYNTGAITGLALTAPVGSIVTFNYTYDNETLRQEVVPTIVGVRNAIMLTSRPHRLAIEYDELANFESKNDYGEDLSAELVKQAVGELMFQIDGTIVKGLTDAAQEETVAYTFSQQPPAGATMLTDYYKTFGDTIEDARNYIFKKTQKYNTTYMIMGVNVKRMIKYVDGWKGLPQGRTKGPYKCGTIDGLDCYLDPRMDDNMFVLGVNDTADKVSSACFGIYVPIMKSQLLQFRDFASSQGFVSMYDWKIMNTNLLAHGTLTGVPVQTASPSAALGFTSSNQVAPNWPINRPEKEGGVDRWAGTSNA